MILLKPWQAVFAAPFRSEAAFRLGRDRRRSTPARRILHLALCFLPVSFAVGCQNGEAASPDARVPLSGAQAKPRGEPLIMGVAVHFGIGGQYGYDPDASLRSIARLGLNSVRDDLPWSAFDRERPANGLPVRLGEFVPRAIGQGIRPLMAIGHGNPDVEGGSPPITDAGQNAFADFAGRATKATANLKPMFEIWNEWNMIDGIQAAMQGRAGDAAERRAASHYIPLALKASKAVRGAQPNATILVGGTGMDPGWAWAEAVFRAGAMKYANGFSIHLYNHCDPDLTKRTATDAINQAEDLQKRLRAISGRAVPIYVTEVGWPTTLKSQCPTAPETSANNIAQFMLWSAATPWMKGVWIYQLKDQGRDPTSFEDNFGILDYDYKDKPAACAVQAASAIIKGAQSWAIRRPMDDVFIVTAKGAKTTRVIAWTSRPELHAGFTQEGGKPSSFRSLCSDRFTKVQTVPLGPVPVVIDLGSAPAAFGKVSMK